MKPITIIFPRIRTIAQALAFAIGIDIYAQSIEIKQGDDYLQILHNKKKVLLYVFNTNQFKPYVKELYSLDGRNILLDAPPDHLHHHGLMYGITINGINFWEEVKNAGIEFPIKIVSTKTYAQNNVTMAEFVQTIHWTSLTNKAIASSESAALLVENRILRLFVNEKENEIQLEWIGEFRVPSQTSKVVLSGSDYHGLGIRFQRAFDNVARHFNQQGLQYPTSGKHDLVEGSWAATTALFENKPITVGIISDEAFNKKTIFFSMITPFAYLSATQGIYKEPIAYQSGNKFSVHYLIVVSPRELTPSDMNKRMENWIKKSEK